MGRHRADTVQDALLRARDTLALILREFPETGPRVGELLAALGDIERAIASDAGQSPSARLTAPAPKLRPQTEALRRRDGWAGGNAGGIQVG